MSYVSFRSLFLQGVENPQLVISLHNRMIHQQPSSLAEILKKMHRWSQLTCLCVKFSARWIVRLAFLKACSHLVITPVLVWTDQKPAAPNLEWIGVLCEHLSLGVIYITCATGLNRQHLERKETNKKKGCLQSAQSKITLTASSFQFSSSELKCDACST